VADAKERSVLGFRIIGAMKLASGILMTAAGVGLFRLLNKDLAETVEHLALRLHLDPENRLIQKAIDSIGGIDHDKVELVVLGAFCYAALHIVEGTGLLLLKRWAEYLTVIATGSLLPLEIYEVTKKISPIRLTILIVNIAIVIYLIVKLRQQHLDAKSAHADTSRGR
jgi:uncharacterized membrane protein (DUF2068 family)